MSQTQPTNSRVKGVIVTAFCLAMLIVGGFFLNRQRAEKQYQGQFAAVVNDPQEEASKQASSEQERIAVAKRIREKLRPWALQHKDLLLKMRKADSKDTKVALEVFTQAPVKLRGPDAIVNADDLVSGQTRFTWQALESNLVSPNAPASADAKFRKEAVAKDFTKHHDVLLSTSINPGKSRIEVWASGRITKTTDVLNPRVPGQPVYGEPVSEEVIPPYDFL